MKHFWLLLICFEISVVFSEVIEIPNLALYHVTPRNDAQMRYLNRLRTSDTGMIFIHGVGAIDETIEILAPPNALETYGKELSDMKLHMEMEFSPVNIELINHHQEMKDTERNASEAMRAAHLDEHAITEKFLPIDPIVAPDVFSGIFLRISALATEFSVDALAYGGKINSTMGNPYLCFSPKKEGDEASKFDISKQWIFEKTEMTGYYVLRNRKLPLGYVTWDDNDEKLLVIEHRREFQRIYRKGGPLRRNVLFKVSRAGGKEVAYQIAIKGMDGKDSSLIVDSGWLEQTGCYLLRRSYREASNDSDDKLENVFKIQRVDSTIKVVGTIEDFKYKETLKALYLKAKEENTVKTLTSRHVFNHGEFPLNFEIEDAHERRDRFHIKFSENKSMTAFQELWAPPGLNIGTAVNKNNSDAGSMIRLSTKGRDTVEKFKYRITGSMQVPAWSTVKYTVLFGWLETFNLHFDATLKIHGIGDRMTFTDKPTVIPDQPIDFGVVNQALVERGFKIDGKSKDNRKLWYKMPIKGSIYANTMGIKGDVAILVKQLSRNISTSCQRK